MNITLTPEAERLIQEKLKSGQYQTAYEVIVEALQLLVQLDKHYEAWLEKITIPRQDIALHTHPLINWQFLQVFAQS